MTIADDIKNLQKVRNQLNDARDKTLRAGDSDMADVGNILQETLADLATQPLWRAINQAEDALQQYNTYTSIALTLIEDRVNDLRRIS